MTKEKSILLEEELETRLAELVEERFIDRPNWESGKEAYRRGFRDAAGGIIDCPYPNRTLASFGSSVSTRIHKDYLWQAGFDAYHRHLYFQSVMRKFSPLKTGSKEFKERL